jgi:hypothetical protein
MRSDRDRTCRLCHPPYSARFASLTVGRMGARIAAEAVASAAVSGHGPSFSTTEVPYPTQYTVYTFESLVCVRPS